MTTDHDAENGGYLTGQLLVAMPQMRDPRFARSVIYMCAHNAEGAMGLVVNRRVGSITFEDLLQQLGLGPNRRNDEIRVHFGGPVEQGRGFVLHSADYSQAGTMQVDDAMALTATLDILKEMAAAPGAACWPWAMPAGDPASSMPKFRPTAGSRWPPTKASSSMPISTTSGSAPSARSASTSASCRATPVTHNRGAA